MVWQKIDLIFSLKPTLLEKCLKKSLLLLLVVVVVVLLLLLLEFMLEVVVKLLLLHTFKEKKLALHISAS